MSRFPEAALAALLIAAPAGATELESLGRAPTEAEIAAWDIDVRPDGAGLPEGGMSVAEGEAVYAAKCASCHGDFAEGVGRWPVLAGGQGTLTRERPVKTVGSYWPHLSTAWDYIHRAMPFGANLTLTDDEVYGTLAYILYMNDIVSDEAFVLSRESFDEVRLPNEDGFFDDPRPGTPVFRAGPPCMKDCTDEVEITMRATVLDVTPEETGGTGAEDSGAAEAGSVEVAAAPGEAGAAGEGTAPDPELVAAGEQVFRQCRVCHAVGEGAENRIGPHLNALIGRAAGGLEGFRYSKAMEEKGAEGLEWTAETLHGYLADPEGFVPRTRMSFRGLEDEADRAAVIAYLRAQGG